MSYNHVPFLIVISAPSGCGKTTLLRLLLEKKLDIAVSVSHTTRPMRKGEVSGVDYNYIDVVKFVEMQHAGEFIEHATVHNNYYGTSYAAIDTLLGHGVDVILDIDVQGMKLLKAKNNYDFVSIFIMPPSLDVLEDRLRRRNTDSNEVVAQRLINAEEEINQAHFYDYQVVNDVLDKAIIDLSAIITAERLRSFRLNNNI
ncbi:MAG: guanylate kinase [Deltaproteobacteria bacterium]|nr:guanylate kinase [Candidatus Tharpella sp.]